MSIFFYVLLRSAAAKMTEEQMAVTNQLAIAADAGDEQAAERLRKIIDYVLFGRLSAPFEREKTQAAVILESGSRPL